jgi:hypothetical protein
MPFFNNTTWVVKAEDGEQCSASADTVVIQSDDEDHHANHTVFAGMLEDMSLEASSKNAAVVCDDDDYVVRADNLRGMAQRAAMKKAAATCEMCESRPVSTVTCISGNINLCEMCDLAEWVAGLCSACGDCPALPQAQKKCPDR